MKESAARLPALQAWSLLLNCNRPVKACTCLVAQPRLAANCERVQQGQEAVEGCLQPARCRERAYLNQIWL